jgi:CheY-like chemotaxis protein
MLPDLVLLIEDDAELRAAVGELFAVRLGVRILESGDGLEGAWLARTTRPALVVLDHDLPGMSGLEVARDLRADPATAAIPILSLAASWDPTASRATGCDAHLRKPFRVDRLLETVRRLLDRSPGAPGPDVTARSGG